MTTFHLIRHGERDTPPDYVPGRAAHVRLTPMGREQAERIAHRLLSEKIDHIFSSPLERAIETAAPLARSKRLPVQPAAGFTEFDFGEWTGKRLPELQGERRWEPFNRRRSLTRVPGGEAAHEVQCRLVGELFRLHEAYPYQTLACFSHADPIRMALAYFIGLPIDCAERLEIGVGSISTLVLGDFDARLVRLNEVPPG